MRFWALEHSHHDGVTRWQFEYLRRDGLFQTFAAGSLRRLVRKLLRAVNRGAR